MLSERQEKILSILQHGETFTSEELGRILGVTSRTIRTEMKQLNKEISKKGAEIIAARGRGYTLLIHDNTQFTKFFTPIKENNADDNPLKRTLRLGLMLLNRKSYLKIEEAAEMLYVSDSTIKNDLKVIKQQFAMYGLGIHTKPKYGISVIGSERQKRNCYSMLLEQETQILPGFDKDMYGKLHDLITMVLQQEKVKISEIGIDNLAMHVCIAVQRTNSGFVADILPEDMKALSSIPEFIVAEKIAFEIEASHQAKLPNEELAYMTMHILGAKLYAYQGDEKQYKRAVDNDIQKLTSQLLQSVDTAMNTSLAEDEQLQMGICLHLKPAMSRFKYNLAIRNPLLPEIKQTYAKAFDASVIMGKTLQEITGVPINEEELGYLALHIGAAMERQNSYTGIKRTLIVCATGIASSQLLFYKLKAQFKGRLDIVGVSSVKNLSSHDLTSINFIISTIPIEQSIDVPVVYVHTLLQQLDIVQIEKQIMDRRKHLADYIPEKQIFLQQSLASQEETLQFLVEKVGLITEVPKNLLELIFERESMAPTVQENRVAVPHPIYPITEEPVILFCSLKEPIEWGGQKVQLVFLFCIPKQYTDELQHLYESMVSFIEDKVKVTKACNAKTLSECLLAFS